ncbi:MAG: serine hydrolase family protein [archaeon]|nr:MAG: serine hydrolase family protein [archaeon]
MKKVIVIHGWEGTPETEWLPWIKKELESKGFEVTVPEMPETDEPVIEAWLSKLEEVVGTPDKNTYFIAHSIGCQTVLRFLEKLSEDIRIGGCVFVAPWFNLTEASFEEEGYEEIARPWLETPIGFEKVLKHTQKIICIFSDDDPYIPLSDSELFKEKLGAKVIIKHGGGHFNEEVGTKELPVLLEEFLKISS